VNVTSYQAQQRAGTRAVTEVVPVTQEVTVHVQQVQAVARTATRTRLVSETVTEVVPTVEQYTEMVPYTYTVPAAAPCAPGPSAAGRHGCG
jgi:hypothetical protein